VSIVPVLNGNRISCIDTFIATCTVKRCLKQADKKRDNIIIAPVKKLTMAVKRLNLPVNLVRLGLGNLMVKSVLLLPQSVFFTATISFLLEL